MTRLPLTRLDRIQQCAQIQLLDKRPHGTRRVIHWQQAIQVDDPQFDLVALRLPQPRRRRSGLRRAIRNLLQQLPKQAPRFRHRPPRNQCCEQRTTTYRTSQAI